MRAFQIICIALCVSAAAAAEVQTTSTWLSDPMATTKASTMSGYRSKVEKETLCFRTTSFCFTGPPLGQTIAKVWIEDNMECAACPKAHHDSYGAHNPDSESDSFVKQLTPILSKCLLHAEATAPSIALPHQRGMGISGTYKATCFLQEDTKGGCKFPATCEDTMVTIQGVIYEVDQAVVAGPTSSATVLKTPECLPEAPPSSPGNPTASRVPRPEAPAPAGKARIQQEDRAFESEEPKPTGKMVQVGKASLYKGTFTVHSTTHTLKFKTGQHQYSIFIGPPFPPTSPMPINATEGLPRLGDAVHMFDFKADDDKPSYY